MTRHIIALVLGVAVVTTTGPLVVDAQASSTPTLSQFDARLLHDINHARAARGIRKLTLVAGTTDVAHHWSCHQASALTVAHDLDLAARLETHGSALWTTYGENVGALSTSYGADRLFHAYMHDPSHRANILDKSIRYVGLWSKRHNGKRYNTIDFVGSPVSSYNYGYGAASVTC
jgi:uncharacterized protein YkwD